MTDLTRKAGDPLGVVVPATVVCPGCHGQGGWGCQRCQGEGRIPNPAAWQTCQTCGGSGDVAASDEPSPIRCHNCNGQGVTPRTLMIPEAVQVVERCSDGGTHICVSAGIVLWHSPLHEPFEDGTVRTLPKPGEWWIVGHRPCELLPVVDERGWLHDSDTPESALVLELDGSVALISGRVDADITSHFPDGPPTTDDLAGVCGDLVLADEAKRVEP